MTTSPSPKTQTLTTTASPKTQTLPTTASPVTDDACFFFNDTATTEIYSLSLHDALPISGTPLATSTATVTMNGNYFSAPFTPTHTGTYVFVVSYSGDSTNDHTAPLRSHDMSE